MPQVPFDAGLQRELAPLVVTNGHDRWLVGRPGLGIYLTVPEPTAVLLTALQRGASLAEATAEASWAAAEEVDSEEVLRRLRSTGLLTGSGHAS